MMSPGSPERPIASSEHDKLERSGFIARLCDAVIDHGTKGNGITTGRDTISKIVDLDEYLALVEGRLATGGMHESIRLALEKAKDSPFG
jgi:hypothetical protein